MPSWSGAQLKHRDSFTFTISVGKPGGNRPFGRPRRRWEDTIRMEVREIQGAALKFPE
jgi:hypothetical protein